MIGAEKWRLQFVARARLKIKLLLQMRFAASINEKCSTRASTLRLSQRPNRKHIFLSDCSNISKNSNLPIANLSKSLAAWTVWNAKRKLTCANLEWEIGSVCSEAWWIRPVLKARAQLGGSAFWLRWIVGRCNAWVHYMHLFLPCRKAGALSPSYASGSSYHLSPLAGDKLAGYIY